MKRSHGAFDVGRAALVAGLAALAARTALGCAAGEDDNTAPSNPGVDANVDSSHDVPDASVSVDAAVDVDNSLPKCSPDGWCYTELPDVDSFDAGDFVPKPNSPLFSLSSVWVAPDHGAWAVSTGGHVLHWNGSKWNVVFVATKGLRSVWGSSATDIWASGDSGLLLHGTGSSPDTLTFAPVSINTTRAISRVWGTSPTDVWVIANGAFHLTAETANEPSPFTAVVVPTSFGDAGVTSLALNAVWGTASETWFAGTERSSCMPPDCLDVSETVAVRRTVGGDGAEMWEAVPMPITDATKAIAGASTSDGLQILITQSALVETAFAARIANDASKLDPSRGEITVVGNHAWNFETAESYGQPNGLWARSSNDIWLVGNYGVARHFDGNGWQLSRVARTPYLPLVNHLRGIDVLVDSSGAKDFWIVGDDVALHRTEEP